jgi:hypothetical protein
MENQVDRESAEQEFERFATAARIKMTGFRNEKDQKDLDDNRNQFVEYVIDGTITVDDSGFPSVHVESDDLKVVKFPRRPKGIDRCAMDKVAEKELNGKLYSWVASATGVASAKLKQLDEADWSKVWTVFQLFLDQRT